MKTSPILLMLVSMLAFAAPTTPSKTPEAFPKPSELADIKAAAKTGDPVAIVKSGICAKEGIGRLRNSQEAFETFKKAADGGDALAMFYLAICYETGSGTIQNHAQALTWAQKSTDKGNPKGMALLGFLYTKPDGTPTSTIEGFRLAKEAAKSQDGYAEAILGDLYSHGIGTVKDEAQAFKLFKSSAEKGSRIGLRRLADAHHFGIGTAIKEQKAVEYWLKAAEQFDPVSFLRLAEAYAEGEGVNLSYEKAKVYAEQAFESDDEVRPYGAALLARLYREGLGVDKSTIQSAKYLRLSAEGGHAASMNNYATLCLIPGSGVLPDRTLAVALYMVASAKGDEIAKQNLAGIKPEESANFSYSNAKAIAHSITLALEKHHVIVELQEGWNSEQLRKAESGAPNGEPRTPRGESNKPTEIGSGSGMVFTPDGHVFTNHHVVERGNHFEIYVPALKKRLPAKLIVSDAANDLAILKVDSWKDEKHTPALPPPVTSSSKTKIGDKVFTIGFPMTKYLGIEPKYTSGDVSSLSDNKDKSRYQISVPIQPGNSGGPLALSDGRIIGVVVAQINSLRILNESGRIPQNINFAVKSDYLRILASNSEVSIPDELKIIGDPIEHVNAYTVQVICISR